jgi:hypothetical protein
VSKTAGSLFGSAALDGEHSGPVDLAKEPDDARPVDHSIAAGAADGRAGDLAALGIGVGDSDVLRVQVYEAVADGFEALVWVLAAEVRIAGVVVDAEEGRIDETGART